MPQLGSNWRGLFSNASPHAIVEGGAQIQENLMTLRPGVLEVRRGQLSLGAGITNAAALAKVRRDDTDAIIGISSTGQIQSYGFTDSLPAAVSVAAGASPCIAQGRQGDIIFLGGGARGKIALYDGTQTDIGITAPAAGPQVIMAALGIGFTGAWADSTYYFGYRWGDALGRWSSLSPLTEVTTGAAGYWMFIVTTQPATEDRVTKVQLYRSLADDPNDLFLIASAATGAQQIVFDTIEDEDLVLNAALPIETDEGGLFARRHDVPPANATIAVPFQDRMFYFGQGSPDNATRNTIWYSEADLPESVPADQNALIMAEDGGDADDMVAGFSFASVLFLAKRRHLYRLTFSSDPRFDGSIQLARNRGVLNQRCFAAYRDSLYLMDSTGPWQLTGQDDFDTAVHNYWTDGLIDFTKSSTFFVSVEPTEQVVRFYIVLAGYGWSAPRAALCYSIATQSWWLETYPIEYYAAVSYPYLGRQRTVVASAAGLKILSEGVRDLDSTLAESSIQYRYRSGIFPIASGAEADKHKMDHYLTLVFQPIDSAFPLVAEEVRLRVYFDHDTTPVACWGGYRDGRVTASHGSPDLVVNLKRNPDTHGSVGMERIIVPVLGTGRGYSHRFVSIEMVGVQNVYQHRFYGLGFE